MKQQMKNVKSKAIDRHRKQHWQRIRLALWPGLLIVLMAGLSACATSAAGGQPTQAPATAPPTQAATATAAPTEAATATAAPTEAATATAAPAEAGGQVQVVMRNIAYMPQEITVPPGTTVVWTNEDAFQHTVTSGTRGDPSGLFDQSLAAGASFSFTFDEPGTYNYYCRIHGNMNGTVVVQEGATLPTQP
jgi:plastocyanin